MIKKVNCIGLLFLCLWGCKSDAINTSVMDSVPVSVQNAINYAGGIAAKQKIKTLEYNKSFSLLDSLGQIEKSFDQLHEYDYVNQYFKITSIQSNDTIVSIKDKNNYTQTINGKNSDADQIKIEKSINSSLYAINSPFNLLDPNVRLVEQGFEIDGTDTLNILEASYGDTKHNNFTSYEPWKFYITKDGQIKYCWVKSSDHYNLIYNLESTKVADVLWQNKRESYRVDSTGKKLYLRAKYLYHNYKINT